MSSVIYQTARTLGITAHLAWRAFVKGEVLGFRVGTLARHTGYCWTTLDRSKCWQMPDGRLMLPGGDYLHEDGKIELSTARQAPYWSPRDLDGDGVTLPPPSDNDLVVVIGKEPVHWDHGRCRLYLQQVARVRDGARFHANMMDLEMAKLPPIYLDLQHLWAAIGNNLRTLGGA